jgi:DNA-binding response OmpR family regulator
MSGRSTPAQFGPVLLIEDNFLLARAIGDMLEELGSECLFASTGETGVDTLNAHSVRLVLSDIELPGDLDGIALARRLRHSHPDIPTLLMTGDPTKAEDAKDEFTVLIKPFGLRQLSDAISVLLNSIKTDP